MNGSHIKRFEVVQNIPSPYRVHVFSVMHAELERRGVQFHVNFMSRGHRDRPASWRNPEISFPHTYWRDYMVHVSKRGYPHFNPGMILAVRKLRPDYLLVGSAFDTFTGLLTSSAVPCGKKIAWTEGNTRNPGQLDGWLGRYKRWVFGHYDHIVVPGEEGRRYIGLHQAYTKVPMPQTVVLPNLIDESRFKPRKEWPEAEIRQVRETLGIGPSERFCICPARLEWCKGLPNFISCVPVDTLRGWKVVILGQGSQKEQLLADSKARGVQDRILIKDYVPYQDMPKYYAAADLFLLPSFSDLNPLSVVEAMHSGLPLLLTTQAGNFPEAVEEGLNGWGFDPAKREMFEGAMRKAFSSSETDLKEMGQESLRKATCFWSSRRAVVNFFDLLGVG